MGPVRDEEVARSLRKSATAQSRGLRIGDRYEVLKGTRRDDEKVVPCQSSSKRAKVRAIGTSSSVYRVTAVDLMRPCNNR